MYRVNMIYSISRNSAFPEVGGGTQCLSPYLPISRNSAVLEVGGGMVYVQSQYDFLDFQEFCISRGGGRDPMPKLLFTDFQEFSSFRGGREDRACTESI